MVSAAPALVAVVACSESPFEPRGEGERVPVGQVIEQDVTADSARQYSFSAQPNGVNAPFLEALQGSGFPVVGDSARPAPVPRVSARQGAGGLGENPAGNFPRPAGGGTRRRGTRASPRARA